VSPIDNTFGAAVAVQEASVRSQISFAVHAKVLDAAKQQGDGVAQLLEQAEKLSKNSPSGDGFDATA